MTTPRDLDEYLEYANSQPDPANAIKQIIRTQPYFAYYVDLASNERFTTFEVKDIVYKHYDYHRSMQGALLLNRHTVNSIDQVILSKVAPDKQKITSLTRLLEMLHDGEAKALIAILTKDLASLYPNLTHETLISAQ